MITDKKTTKEPWTVFDCSCTL